MVCAPTLPSCCEVAPKTSMVAASSSWPDILPRQRLRAAMPRARQRGCPQQRTTLEPKKHKPRINPCAPHVRVHACMHACALFTVAYAQACDAFFIIAPTTACAHSKTDYTSNTSSTRLAQNAPEAARRRAPWVIRRLSRQRLRPPRQRLRSAGRPGSSSTTTWTALGICLPRWQAVPACLHVLEVLGVCALRPLGRLRL